MNLIENSGASKRTKKLLLTCDCGCGTQFRRYKNKVSDRNFFNPSHMAAAARRECNEAQCGPFLELFLEYLGCAEGMGRGLRAIRRRVRPFFLFLQGQEIFDLQAVTASTITRFCTWGVANGFRSAATDTSALSTFFQWMIVEGHYRGESPVIPSLHGKRMKPRVGRPYSTEDLSIIRQLLDERGNARLRAFFEIARESGMRAGEICRIRRQDLSLSQRELVVGLPNKTRTERTARFYTGAEQRIREWSEIRSEDCGHDFLFHNYLGGALTPASILEEFKRTLCVSYKGVARNETGLERFSLHRLRHTQASTLANNGADASTIMSCAGWVAPGSIDGYVKLDEDLKKRNFVAAMGKVAERTGGDQTQIMSPVEFLAIMGA